MNSMGSIGSEHARVKLTTGDRIVGFGCICTCVACFFTPLSTSIMGIFSGLAVLCWFFSGQFMRLAHCLKDYPATSISLLLFIFMCFAISYSPADITDGLNILKKYRELLLLPIFTSMLSRSSRYREYAEHGFISGCIVLMLISYSMALGIIPDDRYGHSIVFHITHNFFMAVLSFWSLHYVLVYPRFRWLWIFVFVLSAVNIFYIAPGRTGMLVSICLLFLFMVQRLSIKRCLVGFVILCSALALIYTTSENFSGRVSEVITEIKQYEPGKSRTSIGQRFDWYRSGLALIAEKPIVGHGTGAYPFVQNRGVATSEIKRTDNPHNEYLFLAIQFGLIGLSLFLCLLFTQIFFARGIFREKQMLLHGVILAIVSGSLINSLIFDSQQGHFYLFMSAALMTARASADQLPSSSSLSRF